MMCLLLFSLCFLLMIYLLTWSIYYDFALGIYCYKVGKASYLVMLLLNNSVSFGAKVKSLFFHDAQAS